MDSTLIAHYEVLNCKEQNALAQICHVMSWQQVNWVGNSEMGLPAMVLVHSTLEMLAVYETSRAELCHGKL